MTTLAPPRHNLPRQLTSFVGRERELAAIQRLLDSPSSPTAGGVSDSRGDVASPLPPPSLARKGDEGGEPALSMAQGPATRLLTLVGPAGSGKTRLALQAAQQIYDLEINTQIANRQSEIVNRKYHDGIWLVELAALQTGDLTAQAIAAVFAIRDQPGEVLIDTLIDFLHEKSLLLILDNCEHVVPACADMARRLLDACPDLHILATSQAPLGSPAETVLTIGPPPLADAVRLFVDRAQAAAPDTAPSDDPDGVISQICRRLDGIPLAIELAAARVRVLTPQQIVTRLNDVFRLLSRGASVALPRHQTLQAALDWSYGLLTPAEQTLLRRLAGFAGGFTAEAAAHVAGDKDGDTAGLLRSLVEKSLVLPSARQGEGEPRYRLLETVRQYGEQRLRAAGEAEAIRQQHTVYFMRLAEHAEPEMRGPEQRIWLERLDADHDNLRAALTWARSRAPETFGRLAAALWRFWYVRGHLLEARAWLDQAVELSGQYPPEVRARVLHAAGTIAHEVSDYAAARTHFEASLALKRESGDTHSLGATLNNLGNLAMDQGDFEAAQVLLEESLAVWRQHGDQVAVALTMGNLAWGAFCLGDLDRARRLSEASLDLERDLGVAWQYLIGLNDLGAIALHQGDLTTAQSMADEALRLATELGDKRGQGQALETQGGIALAQGDGATALARLRASLALRWELRDRRNTAVCFHRLARLALALEQAERAARLLGAGDALRALIQAPIPPVERGEDERVRRQVAASLGAEAFNSSLAAGRAMATDEAVTYALAPTINDQTPTDNRPSSATQSQTVLFTDPNSLSALPLRGLRSTPPSGTSQYSPFGDFAALSALQVGIAPAWVRLHALGTVRVFRGDDEVGAAEWTYARGPEVLFYLLTYGPRTRQQMGEVFWPQATPAQLRQNLGAVLRHVRRALGRQEWILYQDEVYSFNRAWPYWYDVEVFEQRLAEGRSRLAQDDRPAAIRHLSAATDLYQADFLAGVTSVWAMQRRDDLRRQFLDALLLLAGRYAEQGQIAEAGAVYQRALTHAPYLQSAHRGWLRCLIRQGQRDQALEYIETLLTSLKRTGAPLDAEIVRLIEQVQQDV